MFLMDLLLPSLPGMLNHCLCTRDRSTVTPGVWVWADHLRGSDAYRAQTAIINGWSIRYPAPGSMRDCVNLGSLSQRRQTVTTLSIHLSPWGIWAPLCRRNVSRSFSLYLKETKLGSHTARPVNASPWGKGLENPLILKPLKEDQISFLSYHNKRHKLGGLTSRS